MVPTDPKIPGAQYGVVGALGPFPCPVAVVPSDKPGRQTVITAWKLTESEKRELLLGGTLYIAVIADDAARVPPLAACVGWKRLMEPGGVRR